MSYDSITPAYTPHSIPTGIMASVNNSFFKWYKSIVYLYDESLSTFYFYGNTIAESNWNQVAYMLQ